MLRMVLASQAASLRQIAFDAPTVRLDANLPALPQLKGLTSVSTTVLWPLRLSPQSCRSNEAGNQGLSHHSACQPGFRRSSLPSSTGAHGPHRTNLITSFTSQHCTGIDAVMCC